MKEAGLKKINRSPKLTLLTRKFKLHSCLLPNVLSFYSRSRGRVVNNNKEELRI